jgi:ABC-2 type transport system permease protein
MPLLLLAVMTVPALIIAAIVVVGDATELPLQYTSYAVHLQVIIAVFVAAQSPQAVSRDLRFGIVALYFSRPLSRRAYVSAKLLSTVSALFLLMAIPLLVLYGGALLAELNVWDNSLDLAKGLAGAVVFAAVLASFGLVVAAITPRRGIGVAAVIAVLLVLSGVGSSVQGIATEEHNAGVAGWAGLISPFTLVDGIQVWVLGADPTSPEGPPGTAGGPVFALVAAAIVAGAYLVLMLRYRKVSVS